MLNQNQIEPFFLIKLKSNWIVYIPENMTCTSPPLPSSLLLLNATSTVSNSLKLFLVAMKKGDEWEMKKKS